MLLFLGLALALAPSPARAQGIVERLLPPGVIPPEIPAENPVTAEKVELGRRLFFEKRMSADGTVACATCHDPRHAFADGRGKPTSAGVGGALGTRNAPTVLNAAFFSTQFWDGRARTLEEQALQPLVNPIEHGLPDHAAAVARLREAPEYPPLFERAFGDRKITIERVVRAIASFERTLLALRAPIDRFLAGQKGALSEAARRGWKLFNGKARCNGCHGFVGAFPLFTDDDFHNIGVGARKLDFDAVARRVLRALDQGKPLDALALTDAQASELGRFLVTRERRHLGAFKTPQLRNVALTAPYMHDGSLATLREVIDFYDRGGEPNAFLDGRIQPLGLSEREKADLVELLRSFTSEDLDRFAPLAKRMGD